MAKDRELNPVAAQRKKEKAKELKRNRELRKQHRETTLHSMTPDDIEQQLSKIRRLERSGQVDAHVLQKRQKLEEEMVEARKRQQIQADEEKKRAAEPQPTIVIKGLDKIMGKSESKQSDQKTAEADETENDELAASSPSAAGPVDPAVELGVVVPPGQRIWLDEPPGLKKPPYLPPPTAISTPSSSVPLPIALSSPSTARPRTQSAIAPPTDAQPMIHIPLPSASHTGAWLQPFRPPPPPPRPSAAAPTHSHPALRNTRPPPRSSSHAEPPEIDPLDPNSDTALDAWNKKRGRVGTQTPATAAPPPSIPSVPVRAAPRVIPRPAFVPTNLLVKNRPTVNDAAATAARSNVSRPANIGSVRVTVNAAPTVSTAAAGAVASAGSGVVKQRTQAELEYEALMRSLEADGAL